MLLRVLSTVVLCDVVGMKDLGLYRVSGVLSDIQKLKKAFEKSELILTVVVCLCFLQF